MHTALKTLFKIATLGLAAFFLAGYPVQAGSYTYTDINDPNSVQGSQASGINNAGQIVGSYSVGDFDPVAQGFIYTHGSFADTAFPGSLSSSLGGINNSGWIVGSYFNADYRDHGFLDIGGVFTILDDPYARDATYASGINDVGQIVGNYFGYDNEEHSYLDTGGVFTNINDPNATGGTFSNGINNNGQIVGSYSYGSGNAKSSGFLYTNGVFTDINVPNAQYTEAFGINSEGQIVGYYRGQDNNFYGFLDTNGVFTTLVDPNSNNSPFTNTRAFGINDAGQIVGVGGSGGFLASPAAVPEASPIVSFSLLLALGAGGLTVIRHKARRAVKLDFLCSQLKFRLVPVFGYLKRICAGGIRPRRFCPK